jgi:small GTP-binding protein
MGDDLKSIETKIVILGHTGVGKTSMVNKYVRGTFTGTTTATIGAAFMKKDVILNGYRIVLQIWDTAGQERFRSMAPMYYRGAHAAILVFDVTSQETLDKVGGWVEELQDNAGEDIILVMAANKCDLLQSGSSGSVSMKEATEYAKSIGAALFETSAVSGKGIEALFAHVSQNLIKNEHVKEKQREQLINRKRQVRLDDDDPEPSRGVCTCS